jgi:saccharopine dehydrogenase-like NADP-dependent oxidoreductase
MAVTADKFLLAMGPDAMTQLKTMIDAKQPGSVAGDIKTAIALIPDNTKAEMIASTNLLKLIKGVSEMGQQMTAQQGMDMPNFWKGIDIGTTTSCMATAIFIDNGSVRCRTILPKEHLAETAKVMMQVQQQQMNYYMQQSQNKPGSDANSIPAPKYNPK